MKTINRKTKMILLGSISTITLAIVPIAVVACSNDSNITPQQYIDQFENSQNTIKGNSTILPSSINPTSMSMDNVGFDFKGIQNPPNGYSAIFNVLTTTQSDTTGVVSLLVTLTSDNSNNNDNNIYNNIINSTNSNKITSKPIQVEGFLTTNQKAINNYLLLFENSNITWINKNVQPSSIYPNSGISWDNIQTYFNGIPNPPTGTMATFTVTTNSQDYQNTLINLFVTLSAPYAKTTTSNPISAGTQSVINNYIKNFDNNSAGISAVSTIVPTSIPNIISSNDINEYFQNVPSIPTGISAKFYVGLNPNSSITGIVNLSVTLSATSFDTVTSSKSIQISGFSSPITNFINNFNNTNSIVGISSILPSTIPTQLNSNNIINYFAGIPAIPAGVIATFTVSNAWNSYGTVNLSITLSIGNYSVSSNYVNVSGFSKSSNN